MPNWCFDYEKSFGKLINNEANDKSRKAFLENRNKSSHNHANNNINNSNVTTNNNASLKKDNGNINHSNASLNDSLQITGDNSNNLNTSNNKTKKEKPISSKQQIDNQIRIDLNLANKLAETDKPSRNTRYSNRVNNYEANNLNNLNNLSNITNINSNNKKAYNSLLGEKRANSNLRLSNSVNSDCTEEKSDVKTKHKDKTSISKEKSENLINNNIQTKTETLKLVLINTSSEPIASVFSSSIVNLYFILYNNYFNLIFTLILTC